MTVFPHVAMGFHTVKTLLTRTVKLVMRIQYKLLPTEVVKMSSATTVEMIGKLMAPIVLLEVVVLLLVEDSKEGMIEDVAMALWTPL